MTETRPRTPRIGTCQDCGATFEATRPNGRISKHCPAHRVRSGSYKPCRTCGKLCRNGARGGACRDCQKQPCAICGTVGAGYRYCSKECRLKANELTTLRQCIVCGKCFEGRQRRKVCSLACAGSRSVSASPRPKSCEDCGAEIRTGPQTRLCPGCSTRRRRLRWHKKNVKRRGIAPGPLISIVELGVRDGWRCHLCRRKVSPLLGWPHRGSPSFDHLVPVVDGGTDEPSNLALAHLRCNVRRRAGGTVQLQLIG